MLPTTLPCIPMWSFEKIVKMRKKCLIFKRTCDRIYEHVISPVSLRVSSCRKFDIEADGPLAKVL